MRVPHNFMSAMLGINRNTGSRGRMASRRQTSTANRFLSTQPARKTTTNTSGVYLNVKNNAGELQSTASKLTGTGDDSLFAKAEKSGDTTEVTKEIKNFVSQYNSMVRSMKTSGDRVDNSYVNQLSAYATMHRSSLQATGVTKQSDGTLSIDENALKGASLELLKKAWGGSGSFAAKAGTMAVNVQSNAVANMNSAIGNSYSNLLRSYGTRGNFFNFWS